MKINQELFFSKKCEVTDPGDAKEQLLTILAIFNQP